MPSRIADHPVDPIFLSRWSPRAFDASDMPQEDLLTIFEAGRWAPSAFNVQPWRFLYAHRADAHWDLFLDLLIPWNQQWAKNASVLIYILSDTMMPSRAGEKPSRTHSFDAGAAWSYFALEATRLGYQAHGMAGVDFDRAQAALAVPDRYRIEAAAVIGRMAAPSTLPEDLQSREEPSGRRPLNETAFRGRFPE